MITQDILKRVVYHFDKKTAITTAKRFYESKAIDQYEKRALALSLYRLEENEDNFSVIPDLYTHALFYVGQIIYWVFTYEELKEKLLEEFGDILETVKEKIKKRSVILVMGSDDYYIFRL